MLFQIVHKSPTKIINMGKNYDQRNASYYAFKKIKKKKQIKCCISSRNNSSPITRFGRNVLYFKIKLNYV
jgi:hypothetical protein